MSIVEKRMFKMQKFNSGNKKNDAGTDLKRNVVEASSNSSSAFSTQIEAAFGERRNQLLGMLGGSAKNSVSSYISSKAMSSSPSFSKNDISSFDSRGNEVAERFG